MSSPVSWEDYATGPSECAPEYASLWDGLVGLWAPALGPTGNALFDLSGHNNHGTMRNMVPAEDWVGGPSGWALDFDGSNDCVLFPSTATDWSVSNAFTAVARCSIPVGTTGERTLIAAYDYSLGRRIWNIKINGGDGLAGYYWGMASSDGNYNIAKVAKGPAIQYGTITTLALTFSPHQTYLYFQGSLAGTNTSVAALYSAVVPVSVGCILSNSNPGTHYWSGLIDCAALYNRALSAEEVRAWSADPLGLLRPAGFGAELWYIAAGGGTAYTSTLTDAIGLADSITRAMTRAITDALNSSDTILRATARTVTEALTIADAVTRGTGRTITDAASLTDAILRGTSRALTDATSAADTITRGTGRAITDSIGATDPAILRAMARIYADTVGVADARNVAMARAIADALGLADTATVTLMGTAATGLRDVLVIVDTRDRLIIGDLRSILRAEDTRDNLNLL